MIFLFLLSFSQCLFDYKNATVSLTREDRACNAYDGYVDRNNEKSCAVFTMKYKPSYDWMEANEGNTEEMVIMYWYDKSFDISQYLNVEFDDADDLGRAVKYMIEPSLIKNPPYEVCDIGCVDGGDPDDCYFDGLLSPCQLCNSNQVVNDFNNKCVDVGTCTPEDYYIGDDCPSTCTNGCQDLYYYCSKAQLDETLCDDEFYIGKCQDYTYFCPYSQRNSQNATVPKLRSKAHNKLYRPQTNAKTDTMYFLRSFDIDKEDSATWKTIQDKLGDLKLAVVYGVYKYDPVKDEEEQYYYILKADAEWDAALFSLPTRVAAVCAMFAGLVLTWLL